MKFYNTIIVGSGPSGIMCASQIKSSSVLLLEKNNDIGGKIKVSGGGRCNVTNNKNIDLFLENIVRNKKFLYPTLNKFSSQDVINFFTKNNLSLKEEDHNRMFPSTNNSEDVIQTFKHILRKKDVHIKTNYSVEKIEKLDNLFLINDEYTCTNLVLATGGMTYHNLGTTGDGYKFSKLFGHTITELLPSETPLVSNDTIIQEKTLQGISVANVIATLYINNKPKIKKNHDLLITHFGLSGPVNLELSYYVAKALKEKKTCRVVYNLNNCNIPKRLLPYLENNLIEFNIHDTKGFKVAFLTAGGINTKEINPYTFESKKQENLYLIGELIDINAHTGGYNITTCLSEGYSCADAINNKIK